MCGAHSILYSLVHLITGKYRAHHFIMGALCVLFTRFLFRYQFGEMKLK